MELSKASEAYRLIEQYDDLMDDFKSMVASVKPYTEKLKISERAKLDTMGSTVGVITSFYTDRLKIITDKIAAL